MRGALYDLERLGIVSNDTAITAFVHAGVERSSAKRLEQAAELETALIAHMREAAHDQGKGDTASLHLRIASQMLRDRGLADPLPERLWRIVRGIANDGRGEDGAAGSLSVRKQDAETARITLRREWEDLEGMAQRRRAAAGRLLEHLLACLPKGSRGTDLLAETTLGKLLQAIEADLMLKTESKDTTKLLDRALMWLHELEVIRLNKGLAVFRPAMTVRLAKGREAGLRERGLQAPRPPLQGPGLAGPRDGGLRPARPCSHAGRAAPGAGLLHAEGGGIPRPLAARPRQGDRPPDHARLMAGHRREPEESRPAAHRRRRPGADQRAGARRPRLGQDAGAGAPHRLPGPRHGARMRAASWRSPTTATRRSTSAAASRR